MNEQFYSREATAEEQAAGFGLYLVNQDSGSEETGATESLAAVMRPIEASDAIFKMNSPISSKPEYVHFCYGTKIFDHEEEDDEPMWHPTALPPFDDFKRAIRYANPGVGLHGTYQIRRYPFKFQKA